MFGLGLNWNGIWGILRRDFEIVVACLMLLPIAFLSHLTFIVSKVCEGNFGYRAGISALLLRKHPVYTMTEHPVSGGISEHSQLAGVGAMIYTSRLLCLH